MAGRLTARDVLEIAFDSGSDLDLNGESDDEFVDQEDSDEISAGCSGGVFNPAANLSAANDNLSSSDNDSSSDSDNYVQMTRGGAGGGQPTTRRGAGGGQPRPSRPKLAVQRANYQWRPVDTAPQLQPFQNHVGPTALFDGLDDAWDVARLFLHDDVIDIVVMETNRYASQYFANAVLSPNARGREWKKDVTSGEMKKFLGLVILTGIIRKPTLRQYWSSDPVLATPFFGDIMGRNRFELILKFLHFNDNEAKPSNCTDKLYKIRPVYDRMVSFWRDNFDPGEKVCIDEGVLKWRGRLSFRVYNKDKPTKYGIKSYILCDSATAYCWNLDMYACQGHSLQETVIGLLDRLLQSPRSLYMDNFYNSVELSKKLINEYQIHTVGTLRKNRGEPKDIRQVGDKGHTIPKFDTVSKTDGTVMVLAWQDKRTVRMISTKHDDTSVEVQRRKKGGHGEMETIQKPVCVIDYNDNMSGVDRLDQMISCYPFTRKTLKWHKKVFFYLLEIAIHNAFIVHKLKSANPKKTLYEFQMEIVRNLCCVQDLDAPSSSSSDINSPQPPPKASKQDPRSRLSGGFAMHHLERIPPTEKKKYAQRPCRVCAKRGIRKDTRFLCSSCCVPLCAKKCFAAYHSKKNLKGDLE